MSSVNTACIDSISYSSFITITIVKFLALVKEKKINGNAAVNYVFDSVYSRYGRAVNINVVTSVVLDQLCFTLLSKS